MNRQAKRDWFKSLKWGVFCHYLADPAGHAGPTTITAEAWNRRVDSFDTNRLARQLASVNARYAFITLGQNSGHYIAPNAAYDRIVDEKPSLCARRDLVADFYESLRKEGIALFLYLPPKPPEENPLVLERMQHRKNCQDDARPVAQMLNWEDVVREWSLRWGKKINGWWVDGPYNVEDVYNFPTAPNLKSLAEAFRAGNPDALIAFNPSVHKLYPQSAFEDYTAGEQDGLLQLGQWADGKFGPYGSEIKGAQLHFLNFLGKWWGQGPPRMPTALAVGYTQYVTSLGGVMSWDVPLASDGLIADDFMAQLAAIGETM